MAITGLDTYFSMNIEDIIITRGNNNSVTITLTVDKFTIQFKMKPVAQKITLRLRDCINNLIETYLPIFENNVTSSTRPIPQVSISDGTTKVERRIINGGYNPQTTLDEDEFIRQNFLTWRPQVAYTFYESREQLLVANVGEAMTRRLQARIYFKTHPPLEISMGTFSQNNILARVNVSALRMKERATAAKIEDEIVAYDIYGSTDMGGQTYDNSPFPQRFIIGRSNAGYSHFVFQNTLGGFDTVTAFGVRKSTGTGDAVTATIGGAESEVGNDIEESWEVNTGNLGTEQEANLWRSFLRSMNRYVIMPDGSLNRIIVSEYKSEYRRHEVNAFTFTYHYTQHDNVNVWQKQALPDFIG